MPRLDDCIEALRLTLLYDHDISPERFWYLVDAYGQDMVPLLVWSIKPHGSLIVLKNSICEPYTTEYRYINNEWTRKDYSSEKDTAKC